MSSSISSSSSSSSSLSSDSSTSEMTKILVQNWSLKVDLALNNSVQICNTCICFENKWTNGSFSHLTVNYSKHVHKKEGPALLLIFGYRLISCIEKKYVSQLFWRVYTCTSMRLHGYCEEKQKWILTIYDVCFHPAKGESGCPLEVVLLIAELVIHVVISHLLPAILIGPS